MPEHSAAFIAVRDAILDDLDDEDRRRIAALLGCMHDARPPLSPELVAVLTAIVALDADDRRKLSGWCRRYLSRWGQVPVASKSACAAVVTVPSSPEFVTGAL